MVWWVAAAGAAKSAYDTVSGKAAIKKAGKMSSSYIIEETSEQVRRERITLGQLLGEGRAAVSASGLRQTGSPDNYMNFLEEQGNTNIRWMERSGMLRAKAAKAGANIQANNFQNQGIQSVVQQGVNAYNVWQRSNPNQPGTTPAPKQKLYQQATAPSNGMEYA